MTPDRFALPLSKKRATDQLKGFLYQRIIRPIIAQAIHDMRTEFLPRFEAINSDIA